MSAQRTMTGAEPGAGRVSIVALAFGATVAMWAIGYLCRLPAVAAPNWLVLALMLSCLVAAGFTARRCAGAGWPGAALIGALAAVLNLLILGSLLAGEQTNRVVPSALLWVPGSILASAVLAVIGALCAARGRGRIRSALEWRTIFAAVAVAATLLVVIAGGVVTSAEAGLAVPDWPTSFGSNMFLYPLSQMAGGIYYEHAHRLYGSLVGLTTIILAVVIWRTDRRTWLRQLTVIAVLMVILQGVMGGLRVRETSLLLAIVHGVFGQLFFVTIALVWAFTTSAWQAGAGRESREHTLAGVLAATTALQVVFGAMYRHLYTVDVRMPWPAHVHLTLAAIVAVLAFVVGLRVWIRHADEPVLKRLGFGTLLLVTLQLFLGLAVLIVLFARRAEPLPVEIILATAHQANGALLFAATVQLWAWTGRPVAVAG